MYDPLVRRNGHHSPVLALDRIADLAQTLAPLLEDEPPLEGTQEDDRFSERRIGIDHLAFGVDQCGTLEELVERLRAEGVETAGVEHDPVLDKDYVAFRDPDNVQWEFYMR
jgi:catechol 2,3-dioxygenase-like lactoylglutathione lyase family enzyme